MYCSKCGQEVHGRFCSNCGNDVQGGAPKTPNFMKKIKELFGKVRNFVRKHKKAVIISTTSFVVALTTTIILIATLSNIFRIGKVSKIEIGMRESRVIEILGEPTFDDENTLYWYENKVAKKIEKAERLMESAFMSGDMSELEKVAEEYDKIYAELERTTCKFIMVKLDSDDKVKEVFLDKKHKYDENDDYSTEEKSIKDLALNKAYIGAIKIVDENDKTVELDISSDSRKIIYTAKFDDGSFIRKSRSVSDITCNDAADKATLKWNDDVSDYEITIPLNTVAKISTDGTLIKWYAEEESIVIPSQVRAIKKESFSYNSKIKKITLALSNISVSSDSFENLSNLEYNVYGNGKYLGTETNPYALFVSVVNANASTSIHENVESYATGAFDYSKEVIFSEDMSTIIGMPKELSSPIKLPEGVTEITIGNAITSIPQNAFENCTSLTSITIPNSVTSIGGDAFSGCSSLKSVTIPDSVTSIGYHAFYRCSSLTSINIPNGVTSIGGDAFRDCSSLEYNKYDNAYYLGNENNPYLVLVKVTNTSITGCEINANIKFIQSFAFSGCKSLTSITIPDSVTSIGEYAFAYCSSLTSVTIGNSVTSIGGFAFYNCSSLTSVTIGNSVTSIGGSAFEGCSSLESITIPNSVKSIGSWAFEGCTSLTIYCEVKSQPMRWNDYWNSSGRPVVWGYKG